MDLSTYCSRPINCPSCKTMAESDNIMEFRNIDYMDPSIDTKENTHWDDKDHQLIKKELEETVETTPDDHDTLPGAVLNEDDAIEITTVLTETICVKEDVNYPIEDVAAESLATTLPAERAQDSDQSSDEELGAEFLREAARNLYLAIGIRQRHKISRMQDEINSLKGVVDLMRTEIKKLQSLVQRHEKDLNKFDPDRKTMEDKEEVTVDTEYDPQAHPTAVARAKLSLQRNTHFRQFTPLEANSPKKPRTETKSPQAGPSRQPVTPQPRPSQPRSDAMDLEFPVKCAKTLELLNKKLVSNGNFKYKFMRMVTDRDCSNLYEIVEFPLLKDYNLTGKGITNGKRLCTLKVFECFADFWAAKNGISVADATSEIGYKLAYDKRISANNKCKAKNKKGK